jgi:N-acetylmuramoyl-L-alanine amidase
VTSFSGSRSEAGVAAARGFHGIRPLPMPGYNDGIVATTGLISRSDLGGLNLSHVPKVFIECGNMRNATDEAMLRDRPGGNRPPRPPPPP